ncbi:MAG: 16S rRNA (cytidine(1402)-2'-O)-methyltransferase [Bacilli bacterium]|nr:16S rRNA (cytidine(1402)-2'-O)-methyltransferase [Bacilli bacterium]
MKRSKSFDGNNVLYLVATPIGNLGEFSERALNIIKEVDVIGCEDTRNTQKLLSFYGIKKELCSLREHNESMSSDYLIERLLKGDKVAYVSDAGYPCISDPGNILAKKAIEAGISVSTICGSSAFLNALVSSGLPTSQFSFYGFISPKDNEATIELETLKNRKETLIFYESPHRIQRTIKIFAKVFGNRNAVIGRELTKINEEFIRGTLEELSIINPETLKGEMVVIIEGNTNEVEVTDEDIKKRLNELKALGVDKKASIEITSQELKVNKNRIKDLTMK